MVKTSLSVLIACTLLSATGRAQNLVPNPSFENFNVCPPSLSGIGYSANYTFFPTVKNWANPLQQTSPDYLNRCAPSSSSAHIPDNIFGVKETHSGNGMAGIIAFEAQYIGSTLVTDYREYLAVKLIQPLVANRRYCIMFYVSPAMTSNFVMNYVAIDDMGVHISANPVSVTGSYTLPLTYSIVNKTGAFLSDTSKWYRIKGVYTAVGGEQWLTLGCFDNGGLPAFQQVYPQVPMSNISQRTYLFVDDVSVVETGLQDTTKLSHDTTLCAYQNLNLPLSGVVNGDEYFWNNGALTSGITIQDTGTYWCRSVRECNTIIDTFHVHYRPFIPLAFNSDTINCNNQPVVLHTTVPYQNYAWSTGATASSITVNQPGLYTVTVFDACGPQQKSVNVFIQPATPTPVVTDTSICQHSSGVKLSATGNNLLWYTYAGDIIGSPVQPVIVTTQTGKHVYYVTQTIGKCESQKAPINVTIRYKPLVDLGNYYNLCDKDTTHIGKEYPDVTYHWSTGESICCIRPDHTGPYSFSVYNDCGISTDSVYVELVACEECIMIPNAFTPNDDGHNDLYRLISICPVRNYRFRIYNRWGAEIFTTTDQFRAWDGRYKGAPCETGVYVYVLDYEDATSGKFYSKKGNITILR